MIGSSRGPGAIAVMNVGALAAALLASVAVVAWPAVQARRQSASPATTSSAAPLLIDHAGRAFAPADFRRIASVSTIADEVLLQVCEPDRIVAFTTRTARAPASGHQFAGKATIDDVHDVEPLLALHPDLVLVSTFGDPRYVQRLRDAGLAVYDLGEMLGLPTLLANVHEVAALVGHPDRGDALARRVEFLMRSIAGGVPASARRSGLYVSDYGGRLFGGASGTSYHDVLTAAGLRDAAGDVRDWPQFTTEQVLALDPDVLVTRPEMGDRLCNTAGLKALRACARPGGVVTLPDDLLDDPGLGMIDAAILLRTAVYGEPATLP